MRCAAHAGGASAQYRNMDCELRSAGVTDRNGPHRNYFVLWYAHC